MTFKSYHLEITPICHENWTPISIHDYYAVAKGRKKQLITLLGKYRVRIMRYIYKNHILINIGEIK